MAPETPDRDPVVTGSLALWLLIGALLLIVTLGWALYDEFFGLRPWKTYQRAFVPRYSSFLRRQLRKQEGVEKQIRSSAEFQALEQQIKEAERAAAPQVKRIDEQAALIDERLAAVTLKYTDARAYVNSEIWDMEHTSSPASKKSIQSDLEKYQGGPFKFEAPDLQDGGKVKRVSFNFQQLQDEFKALQDEKAKLLVDKAEVLRPASELRNKRDAYLKEHLSDLSPEQLRGLLMKTEDFKFDIKQIANPDAGIVDRCESCHLGTREPVTLTRKDMGGTRDPMTAAFTSHPDTDLLTIHDPEKYGCTPCHNGNGMQLDSVEQAHGEYEHWLWPLYHKGYMEAGCQQCHTNDVILDHAPVLTVGKDLFQYRGCMGCHRYQGYDREPEEMVSVQQSIGQLEQTRAANERDIQGNILAGDQAASNEEARRFYLKAASLRVGITSIDAQIEQLDLRSRDLLQSAKKVGPDLKEARAKLRTEWIPVWIENPQAFRPSTRMPQFRLSKDEIQAITAFIWQDALDAKAPSQPPGDPVKGKESFETRGCMGCHAVGDGSNAVGGTFGANLSRVGEKTNYDYLVRWIHNPRERSSPYCPYEKRDLTPEDYKKHNLPYVFDLSHSACPNDGHQLQVQQMTIMPSLRLSWEESRDIASYLMTLKRSDASYAATPYLVNASLKARGKALVQRYGCAGCHEIAGLEDEGRIGTELTFEGSKPLEQIDFGLLVKTAEEKGWHNHLGFFTHKLQNPAMFDQGLIKAVDETLRMPNMHLQPVEITALSTFLMGSVSSTLPPRYFNLPQDERRDVQDGWWLVKKYNCMGCHEFQVGQDSALMSLPWYQTPEGKDRLPPLLLREGARVNPEWLTRFLANPALYEKDTDRNGVRSYLKLRMPTFYFSPLEVRKLVRFFQAQASQPIPYIAPKLDPLTAQELEMARALFTSKGAPCLKCHAIGDEAHDKFATAPNFLLAPGRLKPGWTKRWLLDPSMISPGTAMPSGLFKLDRDHWVFAGPTPPIFEGYDKDQADLLVRYMFEITPEEQRRLAGMTRTAQGPERGTTPAQRSAGLSAAFQ